MRRTIAITGFLILIIILTTAKSREGRLQRVYAQAASSTAASFPELASCTRLDDAYDDLFYDDLDFDEWSEEYHENVNAVIEEVRKGDIEDDCGTSPSTRFCQMAAALPPWANPLHLAELRISDVALVLQEYLRVYECAMVEFRYFLPIEVREEYYDGRGPFGPLPRIPLELPKLVEEMGRRSDIIESEVRIARPTLERSMGTLGTLFRMKALEVELERAQRASLDLRNASALTAEASACLPRIWDAKGSLKDLPPEEE